MLVAGLAAGSDATPGTVGSSALGVTADLPGFLMELRLLGAAFRS